MKDKQPIRHIKDDSRFKGIYIQEDALNILQGLNNLLHCDVSKETVVYSNIDGYGIIRIGDILELDFSETDLEILPENIGVLTSLQKLNLRGTGIDFLPESIGELTSLEILHLRGTKISCLPESIGNLHNLKLLDIINTNIRILPDSIGRAKNLEILHLSETKLTVLPATIGDLAALRILNLRGSRINSLPETIGNLERLRNLNISRTKINVLPETIGNLHSLHALYMSSSKINELPESIGSLQNLHILIISRSELKQLPDSIGDMVGLRQLFMNETEISRLPESIGKLKNLCDIHMRESKINQLPESIGCLKNLSNIDLSKNRLNELPECIWQLPRLRQLGLEYAHLDSISSSFLQSGLEFAQDAFEKRKKGIYAKGLQLKKQPVSLFYQRRELIEKYFEEKRILVNSAKVIMLGDGGVGKTYTIKRLLNGGKKESENIKYLTNPTHGVLIKPFTAIDDDQQITIKIWDFGGQHILHSMHKCFLTERTCYVITLSTRTDHNLTEQARYWLRTVRSFAPSSRVIILVNQWTKNTITLDENRLRDEGYTTIHKVLHFSVVDSEEDVFMRLKTAIIEQVRNMDSYGLEFPKSWYSVMQSLEELSEPYISKLKYHQICYDRKLVYDVDDKGNIYDWLLDWFNDLGVCFSYHKDTNNKRLADYKLLNPQWLTRAAYVLITEGDSKSDNGILTKEIIVDLLKSTEPLDSDELGCVRYNTKEVEYVLDILRKFWISFQLPGEKELFPVLCDESSAGRNAPAWYDEENETHHHTAYEFEYGYLPESIVHRLMIFCYKGHYNVTNRWRRGMSVDFDEAEGLTAVVDSGGVRHSITIDIYSDGRIPGWKILQKLRDEIIVINRDMNIHAEDYIIIEKDGIKDRFSVNDVLKRRAKGKEDYWASNYGDDYRISDILGSAYGVVNATIIEETLGAQNEDLTIEHLTSIMKQNEEISAALENLTQLSKDQQILLYLTKDQMSGYQKNIMTNQEIIISIINTMNKEPSKLIELRDKALSGMSITVDLLTLIQFANPGLTAKMGTVVAELFANILPNLRLF